ELYASVLGQDWQMAQMDQRLAEINITNPEEADAVAAAIFGADRAVKNWHEHFRTWRKMRLGVLAGAYSDRLDQVADFLAQFANEIKTIGPAAYLQSTAHRPGE